jgi:sirohydrochlorin cobaltochelatase
VEAVADAALVLLGHGSRDAEGVAEFLALLAQVRRALPDLLIEGGVLEFASPLVPSIAAAFARCVARGARRVLALSALLHYGGHAMRDLPTEVAAAQRRHKGLDVRLAAPLQGHPALVDLVLERAGSCGGPGTATLLLVGRGSTHDRANVELQLTAREVLRRGCCTAVETCFVSLAPPDVAAGLSRCAAAGARHVSVVPYFLHTGVLVKRISTQVSRARGMYPGIDIAVADHFGPTPRVVGALVDRAHEAWPGLVTGAHRRRARWQGWGA